jgi:hypothetical protein
MNTTLTGYRNVGLAFAGIGVLAVIIGAILVDGYWLLLVGSAFVVVGLAVASWSSIRSVRRRRQDRAVSSTVPRDQGPATSPARERPPLQESQPLPGARPPTDRAPQEGRAIDSPYLADRTRPRLDEPTAAAPDTEPIGSPEGSPHPRR